MSTKNALKKGIDKSSCLGPEFTANVELWMFDFNLRIVQVPADRVWSHGAG
jgi:hypothetical protein